MSDMRMSCTLRPGATGAGSSGSDGLGFRQLQCILHIDGLLRCWDSLALLHSLARGQRLPGGLLCLGRLLSVWWDPSSLLGLEQLILLGTRV